MAENFLHILVLMLASFCAGVVIARACANSRDGHRSAREPSSESRNLPAGPQTTTVEFPKNKIDILEGLLAGMAFLVLGLGLAILIEGEGSSWSFWKILCLATSLFHGSLLIAIAIFLQLHE